MTTDRSYRKALTLGVAVAELRKHAGTQFDPAVVAALVALVTEPAEPAWQLSIAEPSSSPSPGVPAPRNA